ncbi:hypothetical protein ACFGVR_13280 [Mucilaginibacter sp. AW1-3]
MTKRLVYILILLLFTARLSLAGTGHVGKYFQIVHLPVVKSGPSVSLGPPITDTLRVKSVPQNRMDVLGSKKIKEVARPKHQSKPEKVVAPVDTAALNKKAKRQRRPEGLERPPEIPRRNND